MVQKIIFYYVFIYYLLCKIHYRINKLFTFPRTLIFNITDMSSKMKKNGIDNPKAYLKKVDIAESGNSAFGSISCLNFFILFSIIRDIKLLKEGSIPYSWYMQFAICFGFAFLFNIIILRKKIYLKYFGIFEKMDISTYNATKIKSISIIFILLLFVFISLYISIRVLKG